MIIHLENARNCYEDFVKRARKGNGRIIIYCAFDLDSLCSLRILTYLLKLDHVKYEVIPIMNYDALENNMLNYKKSHLENKDIKAFILINCGGMSDMTKTWFNDENFDIFCLIIDVHRPTHHNNIHSPKNIIFINDGMYNFECCPTQEDVQQLEGDDPLDDEDENELLPKKIEEEDEYFGNNEEEEEKEGDEEKVNLKKEEADVNDEEENNETENVEEKNEKKKKLRKIKKLEEDNKSDVGNILETVGEGKSSKSAEIDEALLKRKIKQKKKLMIQNYYSGNYFGYPSTYILYKLSQQLNRSEASTLWLFIVSLTESYLDYHCDQKNYDKLVLECQRDAIKMNQAKNVYNNLSLNNPRIKNEEEEGKDNTATELKIKSSNRDPKTIIFSPDYRLFLFRHWNILDSMINSNYTLASMHTWKEPGKKEVQKLLAYMGIPLEEAKQKYTFMKNEYKALFAEKIIEVSSSFGLKEIIFDSFNYQFDQRTQLSASDFVHCLNALLEYPFTIKEFDDEFEIEENFENLGDFLTDNAVRESAFSEEEIANMKSLSTQNRKYQHFWTCYNFLSLKNSKMVKVALELAIKFQTAIVSHGTTIIDKRSISPSKDYRYAIINNALNEDMKYFYNPASLEKLAIFVMDTYHNCKLFKANVIKPFILAIANPTNKSYIVAGILGHAKTYDNEKNQFPIRFRLAGDKLGANLILNNFNDSIIEIERDNFMAFMEYLCEETI